MAFAPSTSAATATRAVNCTSCLQNRIRVRSREWFYRARLIAPGPGWVLHSICRLSCLLRPKSVKRELAWRRNGPLPPRERTDGFVHPSDPGLELLFESREPLGCPDSDPSGFPLAPRSGHVHLLRLRGHKPASR